MADQRAAAAGSPATTATASGNSPAREPSTRTPSKSSRGNGHPQLPAAEADDDHAARPPDQAEGLVQRALGAAGLDDRGGALPAGPLRDGLGDGCRCPRQRRHRHRGPPPAAAGPAAGRRRGRRCRPPGRRAPAPGRSGPHPAPPCGRRRPAPDRRSAMAATDTGSTRAATSGGHTGNRVQLSGRNGDGVGEPPGPGHPVRGELRAHRPLAAPAHRAAAAGQRRVDGHDVPDREAGSRTVGGQRLDHRADLVALTQREAEPGRSPAHMCRSVPHRPTAPDPEDRLAGAGSGSGTSRSSTRQRSTVTAALMRAPPGSTVARQVHQRELRVDHARQVGALHAR